MRAPPGPHGGCFYWGDGWCHSLRRRLVVPERSLRVWASAAGGLGHPGGLLWRWTCRTCSWLENQGLHQELLGAWLGWLDRRWGTGQWGAHWVEGTRVPWERWVGEAVWPPLDVTGLGLRMEIEARELELEVREFPVHFRDHKADKQWPGAPSRISPMAEVTMGMTKMHPTLIPVPSRRWNSLWLHSSNLIWGDQLIAIVPWERMRGESREGGMNGERLKESPGIFFFNMKALAKGQSHCQGSQTCKNIHQASLRRWEHAERSPAFFFSPGSWSFFWSWFCYGRSCLSPDSPERRNLSLAFGSCAKLRRGILGNTCPLGLDSPGSSGHVPVTS